MANLTNETQSKANGATHEFKSKIQGPESVIEKMSHDAGEKLGTMASSLAHSANDLGATATEYLETSRQYVKENPAKVLAVAAVAGAVAGSLLTLAMRRK